MGAVYQRAVIILTPAPAECPRATAEGSRTPTACQARNMRGFSQAQFAQNCLSSEAMHTHPAQAREVCCFSQPAIGQNCLSDGQGKPHTHTQLEPGRQIFSLAAAGTKGVCAFSLHGQKPHHSMSLHHDIACHGRGFALVRLCTLQLLYSNQRLVEH